MKPGKHPGLFIAFEGLDGSGSQHHAAAFALLMEREGYRVLFSHEPTNSMIGGLIRARISGEWDIAPETLQLLFTADRAEHLRSKILPALAAGKIVVCDRYILSALAYNVILVNDPDWLRALNQRFPEPDLTFLFRVDPKLCARRVRESLLERSLSAEVSKQQQVWTEFQRLATETDNVELIEGERDDVAIIDELAEITQRYLTRKKL